MRKVSPNPTGNRDVDRAVADLRDTLNALVVEYTEKIAALTAAPTWIDVTDFKNGWVNFDLTDQGKTPAGYYKDALNRVHIRGIVKNGGLNTVVFILPVGYRPRCQLSFGPACSDAVAGARLTVSYNGEVNPFTATNTFLYLHCSFIAEL